MANSFSKSETVFFEDVLTGFDPNNITARNVSVYSPNMTVMERSGLTVNRPMPYISTTVAGRDVAGQYADMTQLTVPSSLSESDIHNVPFTMNSLELNDPLQRKRKAMSAVQALSAKIDRITASEIANRGSLVVAKTAAISTYDQAAECEALMQENDIAIEQARCMIFNARDAANVAGNLANRDSALSGKSLTAYERSSLPSIAGFDTLRASFLPNIAAAAGGGSITVNGAQRYVPTATAGGSNTDNRYMSLTVSSTTSVVEGDAFTIAGVNSASHINKQDTGQLKTFRVKSVTNGTTLVITPPIIVGDATSQAEDDYANCTAVAANSAAIVWLNTTAKTSNVFFQKDAVEIIHGRLAVDELGSNVSIMREVTDSGIEIVFARQGEINDLTARYRLTMWANANMLNTEMGGILLGGQA